MAVDLAKLSDADLDALQKGDLSKVSDEGLAHLSGQPPKAKPSREETVARARLAAGAGYGSASPEYARVLQTGLTDIPVAIGELTGLVSPEYVRQREAQYQTAAAKVPAAGLGRAFGGAITSAPLAFIPGAPAGMGLLGRVGVGAATGAGIGAISQPTSGQGNFLTEKGGQMLGGALVGGALPVVGAGLGEAANWMSAMRDRLSPDMNALRITREALANDPNQLAAVVAANAAQPNALASRTAASLPQELPAYQALLKMAETIDPAATANAAKITETNAHLAELARIAGGTTATENITAQNAAFGGLNAVTAPQREAALTGATMTKIVPLAQQRGPLGEKLTTAASTISEGVNVAPLTIAVQDIKAPPGIRSSTVVQETLSKVDAKLREHAKESNGFIHPEDLYTVRKEIGDYINEAADKNKNWDKRLAGKLQNSLQDAFDAAIETAGGTGWKDYLTAYSAGMHGINQQELAAQALQMYKSSPAQFVDLIRGDNPAAVEKVFGPNTYDIVKEMGTKIIPMQKIAGEAALGLRAEDQAGKGASALSGILARNQLNAAIPNFLSPKITLANTVIQGLEGRVNAKTMVALTKAVQSGASMNDLLMMTPPSERSVVLSALRNLPQATNAMSPYLINRLAPTAPSGVQQQ